MTEDELRTTITRVLRPHTEFVLLFGSHASGMSNVESDVDVAYMPSGSVRPSEIVERLQLDVDVDLIDLRRADPIIARQVLETGILLDASNVAHWHAYRLRVLREYEDFKIERAPAERALIARAVATVSPVAGDVLLAKADIVGRCLRSIREVTAAGSLDDWKAQDIVVLNLQRAIQALVDGVQHLVAQNELGLPRSSYDAVVLAHRASLLNAAHAELLRKMIGFRNVAVHAYRELDAAVTADIVAHQLDGFEDLAAVLVRLSQQV